MGNHQIAGTLHIVNSFIDIEIRAVGTGGAGGAQPLSRKKSVIIKNQPPSLNFILHIPGTNFDMYVFSQRNNLIYEFLINFASE